ncbi:hypothetical protein [Metabacillus sp. Hm71]|uniref:hypothetical protein n=1 Tax=Metabacillus sp. Hm71 TaxID=3450743 RepID=UPI003F4323DC
MKLTKTVTSRKGNKFIVELELGTSHIESFKATDLNGNVLYVGQGGLRGSGDKEDYLIKTVQDLALLIDEKYNNYAALKSFEEWDGVIL